MQPRLGGAGWPDPAIVRLGAQLQGWVQMETVTIGFELWRQLNDFPLPFPRGQTPAAGGDDAAKSSPGCLTIWAAPVVAQPLTLAEVLPSAATHSLEIVAAILADE